MVARKSAVLLPSMMLAGTLLAACTTSTHHATPHATPHATLLLQVRVTICKSDNSGCFYLPVPDAPILVSGSRTIKSATDPAGNATIDLGTGSGIDRVTVSSPAFRGAKAATVVQYSEGDGVGASLIEPLAPGLVGTVQLH